MSALFQPIRMGDLELANRIVVSPMCQYSAIGGVAQPWHMVHIGGLMLSGAGLVIMEATGVEADGRGTHGCLGLYNDEQEQALANLVSETKKFSSAAIGIQLQHAGRKASTRSIAQRWKGEPLPAAEGAWKPWGPSQLAFDEGWQTPAEMGEADMHRVTAAFIQAAARADRAGFELIEIHGAHGYLLHSFLSPLSNKRTDQWGGSFENRARFSIEIVRAVREVWPAGKPLGFRVNSTDWHPDGLSLEDAVILGRILQDAGVDYVVMSAGNIAPGIKIPPASPGHQVDFATVIKKETGLLAMAVGMILHPKQADGIIADGQADLVAIGRAFLDNPRWGIHAAAELGVDLTYADQYIRARPNNWAGFKQVHPAATVGLTGRQLDRPVASTWDRLAANGVATNSS